MLAAKAYVENVHLYEENRNTLSRSLASETSKTFYELKKKYANYERYNPNTKSTPLAVHAMLTRKIILLFEVCNARVRTQHCGDAPKPFKKYSDAKNLLEANENVPGHQTKQALMESFQFGMKKKKKEEVK